jgi:hypothetical protein
VVEDDVHLRAAEMLAEVQLTLDLVRPVSFRDRLDERSRQTDEELTNSWKVIMPSQRLFGFYVV